MAGGGAGPGPFALLTRHFFGRLFHNDLVEFEDQMKERLIVALALLAVFFFWASELMLFKYHFVPDTGRSWQEKSYLLTLMMLVFGIVTLLEWDVLFPDRRDFLNLMPLPVRLRTVFAAKLASFVLFAAAFSAAMTGLSSVLFSIYLAQWRGDTLAMAGRYVAAHVLAGFAACFTVLFAVIALQALLLAVLPEGLYRRTALAVRFALIAGAAFLLLSFVAAPSVVAGLFRDLELLKETRHPFVFRFPPLWFVGLYEVLLGTRDAVFEAQARTAGLAVALASVSFLGASVLSYRRHVLRTLEVRKGRPALAGLRETVRRALTPAFFRGPEERAVAGFFSGTLRTSAPHRMSLVYYLAVGAALLTVLLAANRAALRAPGPDNGLILVLPLLIAFAVATGVRVVVDRPAAPEARWLFRLTETGRTDRYAAGLKKAVWLGFIVPLFLAVFVLHAFLWGAATAALHAAFGLAVSTVGLEALFHRYRKVPFACSWVPGRLKLHFTAVPILIGLILAGTALAAWEKAILAGPRRGLAFAAFAAAAWGALKRSGRRFYRTADLTFDEEPEAAMVGFPGPD
jgi:uncharacterized protein YhhL (DUF1145 family)